MVYFPRLTIKRNNAALMISEDFEPLLKMAPQTLCVKEDSLMHFTTMNKWLIGNYAGVVDKRFISY